MKTSARGSFVGRLIGVLAATLAASSAAQSVGAVESDHSRLPDYKTVLSLDVATGSTPSSELVQGRDQLLYGTTQMGGAYSGGTVFRMTADGRATVLHSFIQNGQDGLQPAAGLLLTREGDLYGTTPLGGAYFSGTVFRISRKGVYSVVHSFQGGPTDGNQSYAPLVQTGDGRLFGTTSFGGANNMGCVFELTAEGVLTVLHSFDGTDGTFPQWGLTLARDGSLYGTTVLGGDSNGGTIYRIGRNGSFSVLYSFEPGVSGAAPTRLIQARDGRFYGVATMGGTPISPGTFGGGTIFRMTAAGSVAVLHTFTQGAAEGDYPVGIVQSDDGNFYGTTASFGGDRKGTLFRMTTSGAVTVLHAFSPGSAHFPNDGALPLAPPIQAASGNLYGTTTVGGMAGIVPGYGTVYRIKLDAD
jgi:uncharacterized repeat protein (TIGR03803 family)